ncbi:glycosyltransferase family 4 protein [Blastopirellula retiformator]|uniref:Putative glycosyltransferase EpsD n=1 Tax=Blastopirellula retiformator TaxID=2527970 RepID=A0A5C5UZX1_9BACT|nr:glycosyltransferase family 4 protein [Blastopirellula retiformator]TWT31936.1 putative glycosyltransferase EpsD [Blastopirellula retiformator]
MRIAHVITRMIVGGAQENTLYNCQDLIRDFGDDVLLITGPSPGREGTLLDRTNHQVPVALAPHLVRNIYPWHDVRGYYELKKILRDFRPDVVHTHSAKGGMLGRLAATSLRVPAVIHTVHGAPFHPYQSAAARKFFIACERYAAKRCDKMICVADAMTDLMVDAQVAPREKFTTIYSGMEVEPFLQSGDWRNEMRQKLGYSEEHVVIGKIARLFHLKGHEFVLAAAKRVIEAVPNVRFLWIGDGLLHDKYVEEISAAGLTDHFQLAGLVPPTDIPKYCGAMDILVHASLREGLARALPQALLSGKPAVSFDVDGAREVVVTGETGELIPPKDVDQLADALIRLASDAALRQRLGEEGRRRAAQVFPHRHMTAEIRKTYEQVLADKS